MKITDVMIEHLNQELWELGSGIRCRLHTCADDTQYVRVTVLDPCEFCYDPIVNPTDKFCEWLRKFFSTNYNITLDFNNTRAIFWSIDFSRGDIHE